MLNSNGYDQAIKLIHKSITGKGFLASIEGKTNYRRIWTRDSMITGLAAVLSEDERLVKCFGASLKTIFKFQHTKGFIPSNIETKTKAVSYGGTVGRVDNVCLAIIGLANYSSYTGDKKILRKYRKQVSRLFTLLDAWEFNGKGLIYVPQSADWADEYFHHGYILYDQLLRIWAMESWGKLTGNDELITQSTSIRKIVEDNFWNNQTGGQLYSPNMKHQLEKAPMNFWFMGFNPSRIYSQFDLQANSLALLLRMGNEQQSRIVANLMLNFATQMKAIIPSFYPPVEDTDGDMKELRNNYAFDFRNYPNEFHNGGLWPVWNGLAVYALKEAGLEMGAIKLCEYIHESNEKNAWQFNECIHGLTKEPIGVEHCTWSAAGAVIAEKTIEGNKLFF